MQDLIHILNVSWTFFDNNGVIKAVNLIFGGEKMNIDNLAELFINEFTEFKPLLEDHIEFNEELLPHVFFR
jgi:hypothetical protein